MEEKTCYSVLNPYFLSDRFVYAHHKELSTVYIKLNCSEEIEEIGVDIVKRIHNTPLDKIKELRGFREANEIEQALIEHIGEEYWHRIYKNSKQDLDMSKRSEEAALKAYPKRREGDSRGSYDSNSLSRTIYKQGYEQAEKELLNKLEEIQAEYKGKSHDAKSKENYIYASGLCEATARIIKFIKNDEEQTEWGGTEIAPPIDSDVCG